jgi:type II secretory pathway component PulC
VVKGQLKNWLNHPYLNKGKIFFDDLLAPLFSTEWGRRASWGVLVLFLCLFVINLIQTVIAWYDDVMITRLNTSLSLNTSTENVAQSIAQIPSEHLFGKLGSSHAALPITSLQIRLIGVIKADPEKFSRVIISESGQPGKIYSIGDSLSSGIIINSITDEGVILENDGHLEKLPLQRTPLAFQGMPKALAIQEE